MSGNYLVGRIQRTSVLFHEFKRIYIACKYPRQLSPKDLERLVKKSSIPEEIKLKLIYSFQLKDLSDDDDAYDSDVTLSN